MAVQGFAPGDVIAEKYRIEREVAQGGMGLVLAARHTTLDKQVAIKCLVRPEGLLAEEAVNRFTREARAAASIESDHVCRVFDVGVVGTTPYMVMEYLDGHDLEDELAARGRLPVTEAVDFILQALDGINAAHALGIVHRDLKPANLFIAVRPDGTRRVKILDFGISKVEGRDAKLTDTQGSFGTPFYMSPEQVKNAKHADLRTDIWALGAILYELVSGETPFKGETSGEVLAAVLESTPAPLGSLVGHLPEELARVVHRCLIRDREQRFATARDLAAALAPFGSGSVPPMRAIVQRSLESTSSVNLALPTIAESSLHLTAASGWTTGKSKRSRRRVGVVAALALTGVLVAGLAWTRARLAAIPSSSSASTGVAAVASEPRPPPSTATEEANAPAIPASNELDPGVAPSSRRPPAPAKSGKPSHPTKAPAPAKSEGKRSVTDILKDSY